MPGGGGSKAQERRQIVEFIQGQVLVNPTLKARAGLTSFPGLSSSAPEPYPGLTKGINIKSDCSWEFKNHLPRSTHRTSLYL